MTTRTDAADKADRRRRRVPYLLLAPGMAWLLLFYVIPMFGLAITSLQEGSLEQGYTFTGNIGSYVSVFTTYLPQLRNSLMFALGATVVGLLVGYPLGIRDRLLHLAVEEPLFALDSRAISRPIPVADACLARDPCRSGGRRQRSQDGGVTRGEWPAAIDRLGHIGGPGLQLPGVYDPCRSMCRSTRSSLRYSKRPTTCTPRRGRRFER